MILNSIGCAEQSLAPEHILSAREKGHYTLCVVCKARDSSGSRKDLPTRRPPISLHPSISPFTFPPPRYSSFAVIAGWFAIAKV